MSRAIPRLLAAAFRVGALATLVLVGMLACTAAVAAGLAYCQDGALIDIRNLIVGLVCSLIAALFVAAFHLRRETTTLPVDDGPQFLADARVVLQEMGYVVSRPTPAALTSRPAFHALLFGQGIALAVVGRRATITGPKVSVERLRRRLRLHTQVTTMRRRFRADRRHAGAMLRRVEIGLRVRPEQLQAVRAHIIDVLCRDAEVTCDLHLHAHSTHGIDDGVIEKRLRGWLEQQDVDAVIHKEHVRLQEPIPVG
jgi:hypothetical protein